MRLCILGNACTITVLITFFSIIYVYQIVHVYCWKTFETFCRFRACTRFLIFENRKRKSLSDRHVCVYSCNLLGSLEIFARLPNGMLNVNFCFFFAKSSPVACNCVTYFYLCSALRNALVVRVETMRDVMNNSIHKTGALFLLLLYCHNFKFA